MTYTDEILEIVREIPGVSVAEMIELMPHAPKGSVSSLPTQLERRGILVSEMVPSKGKSRAFKRYRINQHPIPKPVARKNKTPTPSGYEATINELRAKVKELQGWKDDAIARFPELAVPPAVAKARKIVGMELRARNDTHLAHQVETGMKDDILPMKVALVALELAA